MVVQKHLLAIPQATYGVSPGFATSKLSFPVEIRWSLLNERLNVEILQNSIPLVTGELSLDGGVISCRARSGLGGIVLDVSGSGCRWRLKVRPSETSGVLECVEYARQAAGKWHLFLPGNNAFTHRQTKLTSFDTLGERIRLGVFTQHGQLFDLRDWVMIRDEKCRGLLALSPGAWRIDPGEELAVQRAEAGLRIEGTMLGGPRLVRRYVLAHVDAKDALDCVDLKHGSYPAWPAKQIARCGFARPSQVLNTCALASQYCRRSHDFAFGGDAVLDRAFTLVERHPTLAADCPVWNNQTTVAREWATTWLRNAVSDLKNGAYLHPRGNPVDLRPLAAAATTLHILDRRQQLNDDDFSEGVELIAVLADLLSRRDFYPHHIATIPLGEAGSMQAIYRGMLNQNFNTDRYAFVGIAGCLIPDHPYAARWRSHAVDQFEQQMIAYTYPGGCWEESHSYSEHVKLCLLPLAAALRHSPEQVDLFGSSRFREMCRFYIPLLSPPDQGAEGVRKLPAIGDHGYHRTGPLFTSFIHGWMARLLPAERDDYRWAWRETGLGLTQPVHPQINVFSPLLIADPDDPSPVIPPSLPSILNLPGYGAAARSGSGTEEESLLVVRCGHAWGHYHPDQGSFWWWNRGELVCADAELGNGALKHESVGHNVLGYPGRTARQYLDRPDYHVDRCVPLSEGGVLIQCQLPVIAWQDGRQSDEPIAPNRRPHNTRTFSWHSADHLELRDEPSRSPGGLVTWTLHVTAIDARRTGRLDILFDLDNRSTLFLRLPCEPSNTLISCQGTTWQCTLTYPEQTLIHDLKVVRGAKS